MVNDKHQNPYQQWQEAFFLKNVLAVIVGYSTANDSHYISAYKTSEGNIMWYDNYDWNEKEKYVKVRSAKPFLSSDPPYGDNHAITHLRTGRGGGRGTRWSTVRVQDVYSFMILQ